MLIIFYRIQILTFNHITLFKVYKYNENLMLALLLTRKKILGDFQQNDFSDLSFFSNFECFMHFFGLGFR